MSCIIKKSRFGETIAITRSVPKVIENFSLLLILSEIFRFALKKVTIFKQPIIKEYIHKQQIILYKGIVLASNRYVNDNVLSIKNTNNSAIAVTNAKIQNAIMALNVEIFRI